jgi:hypothetical protein
VTAPRTETRVDLGTLLAALGAVLLLISLFLDWYGEPDGNGAITGWASFELVDVVLAALALLVLYEALAGIFALGRPLAATASASRLAGPVALVLVLVSLIDDPPWAAAFFIDPELEVGIWLALGGTALMTVGSLLGRVRVSFVRADEPATRSGARIYDTDTETRPLP